MNGRWVAVVTGASGGDHGAHGAFDARARASNALVWWSIDRPTPLHDVAERFQRR